MRKDWLVFVTSCPRREPTLQRTVESLARAGWPDVSVTFDAERRGSLTNFVRALRLATLKPSQRILIAQDDVQFAPNLRDHLDAIPNWPTGVVSLWLPMSHQPTGNKWWQLNEGDLPRKAYGALAYVLGFGLACEIQGHALAKPELPPNKTDLFVGRFCKQYGVPYWYPSRSYCQHIGRTSTISEGVAWNTKARQAGPDWDSPL